MAAPDQLPEASFQVIVSTFATQAAVGLGQIPNPATGEADEDLPQAKFAIDLLQILDEKTEGKLDDEEAKFLKDCLYQFRMLFINKSAENK